VSVTTYTTVNGQILSQSKDGVVHHFVSDPLGSVVMVRDNAGNTVYEAEYDPYGNVQSETGTNPSEFGYVGTLGYVRDSAFSLYVRARYLLTNLGRWLTKDPLWPSEPGFVYAGAMPNVSIDPSGTEEFRKCNRLEVRNCRRGSPGSCFRCAYSCFSSRDDGHGFNYCPKKACEEANKLCGSHVRCGVCGPDNDPPTPGFMCDLLGIGNLGNFLRRQCGGFGADKLAHCVKGCALALCGGVPIGVCIWHQVKDKQQPDIDAEVTGIEISTRLWVWSIGDCMRECAKETYDSECKG